MISDDDDEFRPPSLKELRAFAKAFEFPESAIVSAATPPDAIRPLVDESVVSQRINRLKTENDRREFALRDPAKVGRGGLSSTSWGWVATPAREDLPSGPSAWARMDTSHPIEKMFRSGALGSIKRDNRTIQDEMTAYCRYRAAVVWMTLFLKVSGIEGYSPMLGEMVDGSGDPQARATSLLDHMRERLSILDVREMTDRRMADLDSIVGAGKTIAEQAKHTSRAPKSVRESLFSALDVVSGYARWDRMLQAVQVVSVYGQRDVRLKKSNWAA